MAKNFYIKTFGDYNWYRVLVWPIAILISYLGFYYPKAGLIIFPMFATIMMLGFVWGRYWCGNLCPRGSFFDIPMRKFGRFQHIPAILRHPIVRALVLFGLMSLFARNVAASFEYWGQAEFWNRLGMAGVMMCKVTTTIGLVLALTINPRSWCTICPMGTVQKLLHTLKKKIFGVTESTPMITMTAPSACLQCGHCSRMCPMQVSPHRSLNHHNQVDALDCIKCGTCIENCKNDVLELRGEYKPGDYTLPAPKPGYENRIGYHTQIQKVRRLNANVKEITFKLQHGATMQAKPGQFIIVQIDRQNLLSKAYSISKPNSDPSLVTISVKLDLKGYGTPIIFNLEEGEHISIEGPMGSFTLQENDHDKLFLAAGIGITPFLSMTEAALKQGNTSQKVQLLYGSRHIDDLLYMDFFKDLVKRHENFNFVPVLSRPESGWEGKSGYVAGLLDEMELANTDIYLCGPKIMIDATKEKLLAQGVLENNIYIDAF